MPPVSPPAGWTKGLQIDIGNSFIPTTINGKVPAVLTAAAFTASFMAAMQSDARDLRFTSDANGTQFLPREVQYFDEPNGHLIVHVGLDAVTASTTKTIYAWCNNSSASEPPPRDISGAQSVWNNVLGGTDSYYGVCHFQQASDSGTLFPSDPGFKSGYESTGNWTPVNAGSGVSDGAGLLPGQNAWVMSNSNNVINLEAINTTQNDSTVPFWLEFWVYATSYPNSNAPIFVGDFNRFLKWESNGKVKFGDSGNPSTNGILLNQWNQVAMMRDASGNVTFFLNGQPNGTTQTTQDIENMNRLFQDRNNNGNGYDGVRFQWVRLCRGATLGTSHLEMQWNAAANDDTFAAPSNETDFNPSVQLKVTALDLDTRLPIQNARVRLATTPGNVVVLEGLTDASGELTGSYDQTTPQDVEGVVRKATDPDPLYKQGVLVGTITTGGLDIVAPMTLDE
jgi:hypothetical protein